MPKIQDYTNKPVMAENDLFVIEDTDAGGTGHTTKEGAFTNPTLSGTVDMSGAGSVSYKEGSIPTAAHANSSITPDKLATGTLENYVDPEEDTTSGSYTDLSTTGPAVTVTIGANGLALVVLSARLATTAQNAGRPTISFALSGANTVAANDNRALQHRRGNDSNSAEAWESGAFILSGLTPGSTTFTAKYRDGNGGGTNARFQRRRIAVVPL